MDFVLGAIVFFIGVLVGASIVHATISSTRTARVNPPNGKD